MQRAASTSTGWAAWHARHQCMAVTQCPHLHPTDRRLRQEGERLASELSRLKAYNRDLERAAAAARWVAIGCSLCEVVTVGWSLCGAERQGLSSRM